MKIKDYIIQNFKEDNVNTLRNTITECINEQDEETLPGMGVFLELIWEKVDEDTKKKMLEALEDNLKKS